MDKTNIKGIKDLVVCSFYGRTPDPTKYQVEDVKDAVLAEFRKIASDYYEYQKNKWTLFQIMQEAWTPELPKNIEQFMGVFADVDTVPLGQKKQYKIRLGRRRAKQFITEVGLSGVYESFRLDSDTFEVGGQAIGGAGYIDFERYLSGEESPAESLEILLEGLQEAIYGQIQKALLASVNSDSRPKNNRYISAGFDGDLMAKACSVAGTYGDGVVIYATPEFVDAMGPDAIGMPVYGQYAVPAAPTAGSAPGYATPVYNPTNIEEIAQYGRIKTFRGHPIIEMPQSFTDETNEVYVTNPAVAYIFPVGKEKPVKIVFEGPTQIDEFTAKEGQRDRNMEVEVYQRVGVAILTDYNWCVYVNTDLQDQDKYPTKYPTNFSN